MPDRPTVVTCVRCRKEGEARGEGNTALVPEGWEGTIKEPVCPGCQLAEWHPLCESVVDEDGRRVGARVGYEFVYESWIEAMPPEERSGSEGDWRWCEHLDLSLSYLDPATAPAEWTCAECGGHAFVLVHADYPRSGMRGSAFTAEVEEDE